MVVHQKLLVDLEVVAIFVGLGGPVAFWSPHCGSSVAVDEVKDRHESLEGVR